MDLGKGLGRSDLCDLSQKYMNINLDLYGGDGDEDKIVYSVILYRQSVGRELPVEICDKFNEPKRSTDSHGRNHFSKYLIVSNPMKPGFIEAVCLRLSDNM